MKRQKNSNSGGHGHNGGKGGSKGRSKQPVTEPLDFNPAERVRAALQSRQIVEGITIDPPGTHIIDDGLFIRRHGKGWMIRTSVADLPSIIPHGDELEKKAAHQLKETFSKHKSVGRLWPVGFLDNHVSMRAGKTRPAVTFAIFLDENLDVQKYKISRTAFKNQGEHHDGSFRNYDDFDPKQQQEWQALARALYIKRNRELAQIFDKAIDPHSTIVEFATPRYRGDMEDGRLMVHEVMRLTNRVATEYLRTKGVEVPYKDQSARITPTHVSNDFDYDMSCNQDCEKLVKAITATHLPYVHVNAPMRRYTDYLSLKILGQQLAGKPQDQESRQEVRKITAAFNKHAAGHNDNILQPSWRGEWKQQLNEQESGHPLDYFHAPQGKTDAAIELRELCRKQGLQKPLTAERVINVQNALIHFADVKLTLKDGSSVKGCAFSHDQDHALRVACRRILQSMNAQTPAPVAAAPANPAPKP